MKEDLDRIEEKVDGLTNQVADLRVAVENRLTKIETKSAMIAFAVGAIPALWTWFRSLKGVP